MPDGKKEFPFINEKIKDKPLSRKKILRQMVLVIFFAAVFGAVSGITFFAVKSLLEKNIKQGGEEMAALSDSEDAGISTDEAEEGDSQTGDSGEEGSETGDLQTGESGEEGSEAVDPQTGDSGDVDPQTAGQEEGASAEEPVYITENRELELDDYQKLQNKLYEIGRSADYFIVTVTGVSSDTDWFDTPYEKQGQGSGIIIGNTGSELLVAVQEKVISQAEQISVTFWDDTASAAQLQEYDGNTGVAVISIPLDTLPKNTVDAVQTAEFGNAAGIARGSVVIAVGSPLGTNYSILTGSVTSTDNEVSTSDRMFTVFTTDIVANADGSGVLLDTEGKVIGFIMQEYALEGSENTLTAVSASEIQEVLEPLSNGEALPYLGLRLNTVTAQLAVQHEIPTGAYIISVDMDSPAMFAGLQSGDIVTSMGGKKITTVHDYENILRESAAGEEIPVVVERMGAEGLYTELEYTATVGVLR